MGRSPATAKGYIGMGSLAAKRLSKHVLKVTSDDLISLISGESWAPATKRAMVVAYHQIDAFAAMKNYGQRNGISHLKTPKVVHNKAAPIHHSDAHRLLAEARSPIEVRTTYLGLYAGLRVAESTALREENWLGDSLVFLGKGSKKRKVPVHPELAKVREEILGRPPASKTSAGVIFGRLRDRLDLRDTEGKRATPHTLRRTFSSALYGSGATWEIVGTLLGHELGTTDSYVRIGDGLIKEAVGRVEYRDGQPVQLTLF
jgi:site-specific recombinase XerD